MQSDAPARPPFMHRLLAMVVLIAAVAIALKIVIGLVMAVVWIAIGVVLVVAVLWALKTLVW